MTNTEAVDRAQLEHWLAQRPEAAESAEPAHFKPGVVGFLDGEYVAVGSDVGAAWPMVEWWINSFLELLPMRHRLEYWRERIQRGATLATWFVDRECVTCGAGIINIERDDASAAGVFAAVMTFGPIDLTGLSEVCEAIALGKGVETVRLWTPVPAAAVLGYRAESCWFGQMQTAAVRLQ
jgi:hypothetical protein